MNNRSALEIQQWLVKHVADILGVAEEKVDTSVAFGALGLDSIAAVSLGGDLEEFLGTELPATITYDYPTIAKLSRHLGER